MRVRRISLALIRAQPSDYRLKKLSKNPPRQLVVHADPNDVVVNTDALTAGKTGLGDGLK